jgi:hypothetical protein
MLININTINKPLLFNPAAAAADELRRPSVLDFCNAQKKFYGLGMNAALAVKAALTAPPVDYANVIACAI